MGRALAGSLWTKPNGAPAKELQKDLGRPTSLALRQGRLFWNVPASRRIESCVTPGCVAIDDVATSQLNPSGVTADVSGIYWVVLGTTAQNFSDGALRRASAP